MTDNLRKLLLNFYFDDSGTRHPDRKNGTNQYGDWFALGGVIVKAEDDALVREMHRTFLREVEY
jgi:hypothetical protein